MIEISNLSFAYSSKKVLDNISFKAVTGDIVVVLGQNGTGKSTLLKCMNGILKVKNGDVFVDNDNLATLNTNDKAKLISYVPQEITFGDFNIFDAVLMGRKPYIKWDVKENDLLITEQVIKKFNLSSLSFQSVNEISGGEKQKVAIARALVQDSKIILFDEPTSNLDLKNQIDTIKLIKEIVKENKIAIVTMHDLNMAMKLGTKFLFLKDGKIYSYGDQNTITKKLIKDVYDLDVDIIVSKQQKIIIPK